MRSYMRVIYCTALLAGTGCYHATIETGASPSTEVITKKFASAWIYGLVPPSTVSAAQQCSTGVARVETQLSFVNQLVGFLTLGIYTPMQIDVTCATSGSADATSAKPTTVVSASSLDVDIQQAMRQAVALSLRSREPVYVALKSR